MAEKIHLVEYYHATVHDKPGEAYHMLSEMGPDRTQLVIFPQNAEKLVRVAAKTGIVLSGPHQAFLIQGDDELGALADIHRRLFDAKVNVYASNGVSDGRGGFGYVVYVRTEDVDKASQALGV
jgi:hypothetical protein